jgi:hypothetical protein
MGLIIGKQESQGGIGKKKARPDHVHPQKLIGKVALA